MSERAQCYELLLEIRELIEDPDKPKSGKHRELSPSRIKHGENAVKWRIAAIKNFMNPFTVPDKDQLYCIVSGSPMKADVERDVLLAESIGVNAKKQFITERFIEGKLGFFDPVKRKKLLTMEARSKKNGFDNFTRKHNSVSGTIQYSISALGKIPMPLMDLLLKQTKHL